MVSGILSIVTAPWRATKGFFNDNMHLLAASISFFGVLAFIPTLVLSALVASLMLKSNEDLYLAIHGYMNDLFPNMPPAFMQITENFVQNPKSVGITGALFFFLGFDMLFQVLKNAIHVIFDEEQRRGFFLSKLMSFLAILGLGATMLVSASIGTFTECIRDFFLQRAIVPEWVLSVLEFTPTQRSLSLALVSFFVMCLLILLPRKKVKFHVALICGVVTAILWEVAKVCFTYYVFHIAKTNYFYGSLSAIMVFLLWIYYTAAIFLWVCELAKVLSLQKRGLNLSVRAM